ncbi:hypothetical protein MNV49_005308 [Pseudohyphozyma bogoriensis]|nr:hypothetical protein MNV49_005308 [Pseudohyphozyma bogoriensis]
MAASESIDDFSPTISYVGSWIPYTGYGNYYNDTLHRTQIGGSYADLAWTGTSIEKYTDWTTTHGRAYCQLLDVPSLGIYWVNQCGEILGLEGSPVSATHG